MSEKLEYSYQGMIIKFEFRDLNDYCDPGYYWEVWRNGKAISDNSHQCPDYPLDAALHYATQAADFMCDEKTFDENAKPVLLICTAIELNSNDNHEPNK